MSCSHHKKHTDTMPEYETASVLSEELEDEWMEVYSFGRFDVAQTDALANYTDAYYYQCWGGGPEGGYVKAKDANGETKFFTVNRTWGEPWSVEEVTGSLQKKVVGDNYWSATIYVKIVQNE